MKQYKDLNLKEIMKKADLDFAHYTYGKHQCSCCYGPFDMPAKYWKNGKKPYQYVPGTEKYNEKGKITSATINSAVKPKYILFKNAWNGSGTVTAEDEIKDGTCIEWDLTPEQLEIVCVELSKQLGEGYLVKKPEDKSTCIVIYEKEKFEEREYAQLILDKVDEWVKHFNNELVKPAYNYIAGGLNFSKRYGGIHKEVERFVQDDEGFTLVYKPSSNMRCSLVLSKDHTYGQFTDIAVKETIVLESNEEYSEKRYMELAELFD